MKRFIVTLSVCVSFLFIMSCASSAYKISQPVDKSIMAGKTVFLDITMLPRSLAVIPLMDAGIYNNGIKATEGEQQKVQAVKMKSMNAELREYYANQFNAELVSSVFSFSTDNIERDFFINASPEVKSQIEKMCSDHNAELLIAIVGQIATTGVSTFGINGQNQFCATLCVFDKNGNLIGQGTVQTPSRKMGSKDVAAFGLLFEDGIAYLQTAFDNLGL